MELERQRRRQDAFAKKLSTPTEAAQVLQDETHPLANEKSGAALASITPRITATLKFGAGEGEARREE